MSLATRHSRRALAPLLVVLAALAVGPMAGSAAAEDGTAAWSVTPVAADGTPDARTRIDVQLDPGATTHDQVLVANASTAEQTFTVYAADAFNTADGGYDLLPAATPSTDVGTWVTMSAPTVTIPALATAVVGFDVTVPAGAAPGDHSGGIVVSTQTAQAGDSGVIVDSRVAVRMSVRVSGELAPALEVRNVSASAGGSLVPFGSSAAVVSYDLVNTGNVKIIGTPRVRVSGPFGVGRVEVAPGNTTEVLPGQSFVVKTTMPDVPPFVVMTATVDVAMAAAPGPQTEVPLTSSTASSSFADVPWTGLVVLLLIGVSVVVVVRIRSARRAQGERLWAEMVAESGRQGAPVGAPPAATTHAILLAVALVFLAPATGLGASVHLDSSDTGGAVTLQVPKAPPVQSGSGGSTGSGAGTSTGSGSSYSGYGGAGIDGSASGPADTETSGDAVTAPTSAPSATALASSPDIVWRESRHLTSVQWLLVALAAIGAATAGGFALRARSLRARAAAGAVL